MSIEKEDDLGVFDTDNLYDGLTGNSDNPIDTDEPEVVENTGCASGACAL